jgi:hypothetical protein
MDEQQNSIEKLKTKKKKKDKDKNAFSSKVDSVSLKRDKQETYKKANSAIDELFANVKPKPKLDDHGNTEADEDESKQPAKKDKKKRKKVKMGGYEDEEDALLLPVSTDEEDNGDDTRGDQLSAEYGLIQSKYKRSKIINPEAPLHRVDHSTGLPVYKAALLKVGEGGGTPLCPFDCNCCF